jgi:hypothetical protein
METASSTGGAAGVAALLTQVLPTTLEDLMALALAGGLSYISFLGWPLKRADIKNAVSEKYNATAERLDGELEGELAHALEKLDERVEAMVAPLRERADVEEATVAARQARLQVRASGCAPQVWQIWSWSCGPSWPLAMPLAYASEKNCRLGRSLPPRTSRC